MTLRSPLDRLAPIASLVFAGAFAATPVHAADIALTAGAGWSEFTVDNSVGPSFGTGWIDPSDGSALRFSFTVASGSTAVLTVVDAGFAGDTFSLTDGGKPIGTTSSVAAGSTAGPVVYDFDAALADPTFSRASFSFGAGSHLVGGQLAQSVLDGSGNPLDATDGAVRLSVVAAVPEPSSVALLAAGLGVVLAIARRRKAR